MMYSTHEHTEAGLAATANRKEQGTAETAAAAVAIEAAITMMIHGDKNGDNECHRHVAADGDMNDDDGDDDGDDDDY